MSEFFVVLHLKSLMQCQTPEGSYSLLSFGDVLEKGVYCFGDVAKLARQGQGPSRVGIT